MIQPGQVLSVIYIVCHFFIYVRDTSTVMRMDWVDSFLGVYEWGNALLFFQTVTTMLQNADAAMWHKRTTKYGLDKTGLWQFGLSKQEDFFQYWVIIT